MIKEMWLKDPNEPSEPSEQAKFEISKKRLRVYNGVVSPK